MLTICLNISLMGFLFQAPAGDGIVRVAASPNYERLFVYACTKEESDTIKLFCLEFPFRVSKPLKLFIDFVNNEFIQLLKFMLKETRLLFEWKDCRGTCKNVF